MRVGDDQAYASQAPARQFAQKACAEGFCLGCADVHTQPLATAVAVDANGNDYRHRDDPIVLADLHIGGVDPEIRPVPLDRVIEESSYALVNLLAHAANLTLGDAVHAKGFDQVIDRERRDALDIRQSRPAYRTKTGRLPGSADVLVALADVRMRQATAKIEGDQAGVLRSGRTPRLRRQRRGQRRDPLERPGPPPRSAGGLRAGYVGRIRAIPASSLSCERAAQARAKPDLRGQRIAAQPPGPPSASPAPPPHPPRARPHRRGC